MENFQSLDDYYMARCLQLAERGWGSASPNPMVGSVVLDEHGKKIAEGFHAKAGGPHAEVVALEAAGAMAQGGTLYVSLEPCNHTGKTPPCTNSIIDAGIQKVVCGTLDPNPLVAGSGVQFLKNNGVEVISGVLEPRCRALNEVFFHHITTGRPFVTLKSAMTLNGKIATRSGQSQWLTGTFARQYVHYLRAGYDAILTTAETVRADNPQLTNRFYPQFSRQPIRVVLDRRLQLDPEQYRIFDTLSSQTWVFTSRTRHNHQHAKLARFKGIEVFEVDDTGLGLDLEAVFAKLAQEGITSVLVEAGGRLAGSLLSQNLVNKLYLFYAPMLLPDPMAREGFDGSLLLNLAQAPKLSIQKIQPLEQDWLVEAYPLPVSSAEPITAEAC